jgi:hypothetical protein
VETADLAAVDDQTIGRQQGREAPVLWVEKDLSLLVVEPLAGRGNQALYTASLALNSNRSQFGLSGSC